MSRLTCAGAAVSPDTSYALPVELPARIGSHFEAVVAWGAVLLERENTQLFYAVSRVRRQSSLEYKRTCALIDLLAQSGERTAAFVHDSTRYARFRPWVTE
jgi:hypothetical protein